MANPVDYFEIGTPNPDASRAFYEGVFGWTFSEPSPIGYASGTEHRSGLWDTREIGGEHWAIFYVRVDDVKATFDVAIAHGATVAIPLTDTGTITFAQVIDADGNRVGVWRPNSE